MFLSDLVLPWFLRNLLRLDEMKQLSAAFLCLDSGAERLSLWSMWYRYELFVNISHWWWFIWWFTVSYDDDDDDDDDDDKWNELKWWKVDDNGRIKPGRGIKSQLRRQMAASRLWRLFWLCRAQRAMSFLPNEKREAQHTPPSSTGPSTVLTWVCLKIV